MKTISQTYKINATVEEVWNGFFDKKYIEQWGGGPAKIDNRVGGEFSLKGGEILGKNIEIDQYQLIVQQWKKREWEEFSFLRIHFLEEHGHTKIEIIHEDIPDNEVSNMAKFWELEVVGPMLEFLEDKDVISGSPV